MLTISIVDQLEISKCLGLVGNKSMSEINQCWRLVIFVD